MKVKLKRPSGFTQTILEAKENMTMLNSVLDGEDLSMWGGSGGGGGGSSH